MLGSIALLCLIPMQVSGLADLPLVDGCEQVKFFYQSGDFDSSYVLKDVDSGIMNDGCVDGCVYLKVSGGTSEYCFEVSPDRADETTTEYRLPC